MKNKLNELKNDWVFIVLVWQWRTEEKETKRSLWCFFLFFQWRWRKTKQQRRKNTNEKKKNYRRKILQKSGFFPHFLSFVNFWLFDEFFEFGDFFVKHKNVLYITQSSQNVIYNIFQLKKENQKIDLKIQFYHLHFP